MGGAYLIAIINNSCFIKYKKKLNAYHFSGANLGSFTYFSLWELRTFISLWKMTNCSMQRKNLIPILLFFFHQEVSYSLSWGMSHDTLQMSAATPTSSWSLNKEKDLFKFTSEKEKKLKAWVFICVYVFLFLLGLHCLKKKIKKNGGNTPLWSTFGCSRKLILNWLLDQPIKLI